MKNNFRYSFIALCLGVGQLGSTTVGAVEQGDWLVRVGASHVQPDDSSGELSGVPGGRVSVDSATQLSFSVSYFMTDNVALDLLGALPFEHEIKGAGALDGAGTIARVKHLPPTLSVQYHFTPRAQLRPYAGLGLNYTTFFSEETRGAIAGERIRLDDSWGLAAQLGLDIALQNDWLLGLDVRYIDIGTTATVSGGVGSVDVDIDPFVYTLAVGKRF